MYPDRSSNLVLLTYGLIEKVYRQLTYNDIRYTHLYIPESIYKYTEIRKTLNIRPGLSKDDEIIFCIDSSIMYNKLPFSNDELLSYFIQNAKTELENKNDFWSEKVKNVILNNINKSITVDEVAYILNQSARTLQRKIKEEGRTYLEIKDEIRSNLAIYYLSNNHSIKEVATILGYSDTASFSKSFTRWTGQNPKNYKPKK